MSSDGDALMIIGKMPDVVDPTEFDFIAAAQYVWGAIELDVVKVAHYIESLGYRVIADRTMSGSIIGEHRWVEKCVAINLDLLWRSPRSILLTLIHEAGHALGYIRNPDMTRTPQRREHEAYAYGWEVIWRNTIDVSRREWLQECREAQAGHVRHEMLKSLASSLFVDSSSEQP